MWPEDQLSAPKKPDPVDIEVGNRIRLHRLQKRLSQTALADELSVTSSKSRSTKEA